ncbi:MAG: glycosyltransferase family 4 protein [Planctomycetia bacterium]|nr:glycosyltransferase family 4 protein [Planctomycetia bacterium]
MTEPVGSILLVAGRLGVHDEGWSIRPFLDRLERQGVAAQVLCVASSGDAADDYRVVGCPGLGGRWRHPLAVRGLRFGERLNRPALCHVLQSRLGDVGLAIAEHWRVPYVQKPPGAAPAGSGRRVAVIGTAGPLVTASGFATFLNAARKVIDAGVDAEFVIAGQGRDEVDLRRRADRLRIADRVTFAGIPVVGLRFWSVLDVFCQPSLVPSVARTLATALAFGVPSIASDIEGLRALVTHGRDGLRVTPGDSGALARAVLELLADPDRARELGSGGREVIRRDYHPDAEARALADVYRRALGRSAPVVKSVAHEVPV